MLGIPEKVLRKYCVPDTAETEPKVTDCQLPSEKSTFIQSAAIEEEEEVIFHSSLFFTG